LSYLSITLKLHKPSREKRRILEEAMMNYTRAFDFLLTEAGRCISDIEKNYSGSTLKLSKWVDKDMSTRLNQFHTEPFKDSIKSDFAMTLESYLKLKAAGKKCGFPSGYTDSTGKLTKVRPIFFCRYDIKRDYCLLYNPDKGRYYLKLYLMNNKMARINQNVFAAESKLQYVHQSGLKLENEESKKRYIIVPLSFGSWQEEYLNECLKNPQMLKTARLIERKGEYFITINLKLPQNEKIKTDTWIGISRGIGKPLYYTVTDQMGQLKEAGAIRLKKSDVVNNGNMEQEIYRAANQIVDKALTYNSQVILENIKLQRGGWAYGDYKNYKPMLNKMLYNSLDKILTYKLENKGLPKPIRVSPSGILFTCPQCGKNTKRNRVSKDMFLCVSCGTAYKIDFLGSLNLANKLNKYNADDIKIKVTKETDGIRLCNDLLGLNLQISSMENYMENLRKEIMKTVQEIIESQNHEYDHKDKRWSMVQKIEGYDDFMKHIKFI